MTLIWHSPFRHFDTGGSFFVGIWLNDAPVWEYHSDPKPLLKNATKTDNANEAFTDALLDYMQE